MHKTIAAVIVALVIALVSGVSGYTLGRESVLETRVISAGAIASLTNGERTARGIPALGHDGRLAGVAQGWAAKMASSGNLAHNPGISGLLGSYSLVGENVGYGPSAGSIHTAFMNSPSHRANILERDYNVFGVGTATGADGRLWVSVVFGAADSPPVSAPSKAPAPPAPRAVTPKPPPPPPVPADQAPRPSRKC